MKDTERHIDFDSLRRESLAAARLAAETRRSRFRVVESPRAGEIYFFDQSADSGVEWLLVDDEPDPEGRLPALAVDVYPQVGSRDVALHRGDPLRVGNVRCDLEARLEPSRFGPRERGGGVPEDDLAAVRARRAAIAGATLEPSLGERVADGDPEYWRWRRSVQGMIERLETRDAQGPRRELEPQATVVPIRRSAAGSRLTAVLALAASILLALGVINLWRSYRLESELEAARAQAEALSEEKSLVERELAAEIAELEGELAERGRLAAIRDQDRTQELDALRAEIAERQRTAERLAGEREDQAVAIARLEERVVELQAKPLPANTVIAKFGGPENAEDVVRGGVRIGLRQRSLALLLWVSTGEFYRGYRVEMKHIRTGMTLLATDELAWSGNYLGVMVSTAELIDGVYEIQLFGMKDGVKHKLEDRYELNLVRW